MSADQTLRAVIQLGSGKSDCLITEGYLYGIVVARCVFMSKRSHLAETKGGYSNGKPGLEG